ncbi:hypothetical protein JNUCC64_31710 [Streptomyces sp. JNUCC 64]
METAIVIVVFIAVMGLGMLWIHLLNAQHAARIATRHYSDPLPRPSGLPDRRQGRGSRFTDASG